MMGGVMRMTSSRRYASGIVGSWRRPYRMLFPWRRQSQSWTCLMRSSASTTPPRCGERWGTSSSSSALLASLGFDRLIGLVVRRLLWERKILDSNHACARIFSGSSHTSDLKIGSPLATLPGAWRYRVIAGTGLPGVSILWLGEMESLIGNFYLSVAARKIVWADPSLRYTCMLLGC